MNIIKKTLLLVVGLLYGSSSLFGANPAEQQPSASCRSISGGNSLFASGYNDPVINADRNVVIGEVAPIIGGGLNNQARGYYNVAEIPGIPEDYYLVLGGPPNVAFAEPNAAIPNMPEMDLPAALIRLEESSQRLQAYGGGQAQLIDFWQARAIALAAQNRQLQQEVQNQANQIQSLQRQVRQQLPLAPGGPGGAPRDLEE